MMFTDVRTLNAHLITRRSPEEGSRMTEQLRFREIKPYDVPDSLDDLYGPHDGLIELPHAVFWQDDRVFDISTPGGCWAAYKALLAEGLADEQHRYLNKDRLIQIWPYLTLDPRVKTLWEERFLELANTRRDDTVSTFPDW